MVFLIYLRQLAPWNSKGIYSTGLTEEGQGEGEESNSSELRLHHSPIQLVKDGSSSFWLTSSAFTYEHPHLNHSPIEGEEATMT